MATNRSSSYEIPEVRAFKTRRMSYRESRAILFLVGFVAGLVFAAVLYGALKPGAPGNTALFNLIGSGVAFGIMATFLKGPSKWMELQVSAETLHFRKLQESIEVPTTDVRLVLGLSGLRFDGGEILVWKHILVATETKTFPIKLEPADCSACFDLLWQVCPKALFVNHRGSAFAPAYPDPSIDIDGSLPLLRDLFLKYALRYGVIGLGLTAAASAIITVCAQFVEQNEDLGTASVYGVLALIAGLYALTHGVRCYLRHRSLVRSIQSVEWER